LESRPRIVWAFVAYDAISLLSWFLIWGFPSLDLAGSRIAVIVTGALVALAFYGFVRGVRLAWFFSWPHSLSLSFPPANRQVATGWVPSLASLRSACCWHRRCVATFSGGTLARHLADAPRLSYGMVGGGVGCSVSMAKGALASLLVVWSYWVDGGSSSSA
jgi:hypothetical protein